MADKEIKFVLSAQDRTAAAIEGLRSRMSGLQGNVETLNAGFSKLGVVFGSAFAAGTLTAFIKGTAEGID